jgi:hypothetical protein
MDKIIVSHVFVLSHSRHVLPYVEFIRTHLSHPKLEHQVLIYSKETPSSFDSLIGSDLVICQERQPVIDRIKSANATHKVILHGLYDNIILLYLFASEKALKHTIWSMWGADLYYQGPSGIKGTLITLARRWLLPKIGTKIGLAGDFEYLQQWTRANCKQFHEIGFPAWFYNKHIQTESFANDNEGPTNQTKGLSAIVGNSGDITNNYDQLIQLLATTSLFSKLIFVLNYGADESEISRIMAKAQTSLPHVQLVCLTDKCTYSDFVNLVAQQDALIYNHDRQQGVGTLNIACEYGLDIFIPKLNPLFNTYTQWQVVIHDTHSIANFKTNQLLSAEQKRANKASVRNVFHPQSCAKKIQNMLLGIEG